MNWQDVGAFVHRHKDGLELFGIALVVTMRRNLPWPLSLVPPLVWAYEWMVDALMTLVSLKGPVPHSAGMQSSEKIVKDGDRTESTKDITVTGAVELPPVAAPQAEPLASSGLDRG